MLLRLTDYSLVDKLGVRYKSVNFGGSERTVARRRQGNVFVSPSLSLSLCLSLSLFLSLSVSVSVSVSDGPIISPSRGGSYRVGWRGPGSA